MTPAHRKGAESQEKLMSIRKKGEPEGTPEASRGNRQHRSSKEWAWWCPLRIPAFRWQRHCRFEDSMSYLAST